MAVRYAPLDRVLWCYKRREEGSSSVCCGRATFFNHYLVVVTVDGSHRLGVEREADIDRSWRPWAGRRPRSSSDTPR